MPIKKYCNKLLVAYIIAFFGVMVVFVTLTPASIIGEWDSYSLVTASIINEGNITVSDNDINFAKVLFPEWSDAIGTNRLSGYKAKDGCKMSWYFPTYSILCVPMVLLLRFLHLPAVFGFGLTNLLLLMTLILFTFHHVKENRFKIIILLTLNPIIFYLPWMSAEVCIYTLLGISTFYWINTNYHRAAIFVSLAGTLNPTILIIGIAMILEYIYKLSKQCNSKNLSNNIIYFCSQQGTLLRYGSCFIIALIPFIYNYYNTGYINLTASYSQFTKDSTLPIERFFAYIGDWNFGFVPYYNFIFLLSILLIIGAFIKKKWKYAFIMVSFFLLIYMYSLITHINCGMSGIARYNAWAGVIVIFAVCSYVNKILTCKRKAIVNGCVVLMAFSNLVILYLYGPMASSNAPYTCMTPIAMHILDMAPYLYNPLPSTFNSRINHIDGGYNYTTPLIYMTAEGKIRKILASSKDIGYLKANIAGTGKSTLWLNKKIEKLACKDTYISVSSKYNLYLFPSYIINSTVTFSGSERSGEKYVFQGLSHNEMDYSWTDGNKLCLRFYLKEGTCNSAHTTINLDRIFNNKQRVIVKVNGSKVQESTLQGNDDLDFVFTRPKEGLVNIEIDLLDAVSPFQLGMSEDTRVLALALVSMTIEGKE